MSKKYQTNDVYNEIDVKKDEKPREKLTQRFSLIKREIPFWGLCISYRGFPFLQSKLTNKGL